MVYPNPIQMPTAKPFLTAQWRNLINITYAIDPKLLLPQVPKGIELDVQNGQAFVSFVAFHFADTRLKGWRIPFHVQFPEINLRYYVKYRKSHHSHNDVATVSALPDTLPNPLAFAVDTETERGVCFIREYVPKPCIALVADWFYNEPYWAIPMQLKTDTDSTTLRVQHRFKAAKTWHSLVIEADNRVFIPTNDSIEHYFKEHELGFGIDKHGNTLAYRVEHPVWAIYPVQNYDIKVNFGDIYGQQWAVLNALQPISVLLAQGSHVSVYAPYKL